MPLTPQVSTSRRSRGSALDIVVRQFPSTGTLSSFGRVTIVLAKPLHGTVPKIVGLSGGGEPEAEQAEAAASPCISAKGKPGRVLAQFPRAGVAAAPRNEGERHGRSGRLRYGEPSRP